MHRSKFPFLIALSVLASTLSACGGGGKSPPQPPPPAPTFTVGGTVAGLTGTGLVLTNGGGSPLTVAANGAFTFPAQASGSTYSVMVQTQPTGPQQTCAVANGSGTVTANVTNVAVTCGVFTGAFTVGATVSGLASNPTGLVVTNNGGDDKAINANGAFVFDTNVAIGARYDIRVLSNPYDPYQDCSVENGSGTVAAGPVTAPTITCKSFGPRFATGLDYFDDTYSQYAVDASTGQLRLRGYAYVGANPVDVDGYNNGALSFVLSRGTGKVHAFARDRITGVITEAAGSPYSTGAKPSPVLPGQVAAAEGATSITTHPRLNFLYVANGGGSTAANSISAFAFNPTTGALTPIAGQPFAAGQRPVEIAIDPTGRFAYVSNQVDNTLSAYSIDQTTGALAQIGAAMPSGGDFTTFPVVHPSGKWLYVPNGGLTSSLSAFTIGANGALTAVVGSPFMTPSNLTAPLHVHPSGKYLFVKTSPVSTTTGSVIAYGIDGTTGALTQIGAPVTVGADPRSLWMDSSGRYLITANQGGVTPSSVSVLRINAQNGELTNLGNTPVTPAPYYASLDWSGKFLYVSSASGNGAMTYAFNATTGALTPAATLVTRNTPINVTPVPTVDTAPAQFVSKHAYVPSATAINAYAINPTTGAYSDRPSVGGSSNPLPPVVSVAVHPWNSALLGLNATPKTIETYPINASNGGLSASTDSAAAGVMPRGIAVDPSGRFAYVPDQNANVLQLFEWQAANGDLTFAAAYPSSSSGPLAVAMHPSGRFLFFVTDTDVGVRKITPANGALSAITSGDVTGGASGKRVLAVSPLGGFVFVARAGSPGVIERYAITRNGTSAGALLSEGVAGNLTTINDPASIAIDPTGRFIYVGSGTAPFEVRTFSIDPFGALTPVGSQLDVSGTGPVVVRVDYSGKLLHVVNGTQLRSYSINATTGQLTATGATPTVTANVPYDLAVSENIE